MAKAMSTDMYNGGLDRMANCTTMTILSQQPTSIPDIATYRLANVAMAFASDYTFAAGDVNGRKLTVATKSNVPITATGNATHVSLDNGSGWVATTCNNQILTQGGTVTIQSWKREIADPT
jgi:hypothetical protein